MSTSFKSVHGVLSICTPPRQGFGDSRFKTPMQGLSAKQQQRSGTRSLFSSPRTARRTPADRFVPTRTSTNADFSSHSLTRSLSKSMNRLDRAGREGDEDSLQGQLLELEGCSLDTRMLNFTPVKTKPRDYWEKSPVLSTSSVTPKKVQRRRKIPKQAEKILDAPNLVNDFYANVLDWSKENQVAIGLGNTVHVYSFSSGSSSELCNSEGQGVYPTALQYSSDGKYIAIGTSDSEMQLWDTSVGKLVRRMWSHNSRVGSISWNPLQTDFLSSGSQTGHIHHYDIRMAHYHTHSLSKAHTMDVCGLKWSPNGRFLASGGNDNLVNVWDLYCKDSWSAPLHTIKDHTAAVKALAWSPWKTNLLATGGGSADKTIRLWNASSGASQGFIQADSQVCGLVWSTRHHELISAHGYSQNQLTIWSYPSLSPQTHLYGHEGRILHMVMSPTGDTIATAAADETLRFWRVFEPTTKHRHHHAATADNDVTDLQLQMLLLTF